MVGVKLSWKLAESELSGAEELIDEVSDEGNSCEARFRDLLGPCDMFSQ